MNNVKLLIAYFVLLNSVFLRTDNYFKSDESGPWYTAIDYLYWHADADQLQYAVTLSNLFDQGGFLAVDTITVNNQGFKGNSGVRAKVGMFFCDDWDSSFAWTHFKQCSSSCNQGIIIPSPMLDLINNIIATGARSNWLFILNALDLEIGHTWCTFDSVILRPYLAFKMAQIKQRQDVQYFGIGSTENPVIAKTQACNNFLGFGPNIGIDQKWYFCDSLALWGNTAAALLYGKQSTNLRYIVTDNEGTSSPVVIGCKNRLFPMIQALLGLSWEKECECLLFDIGIGYEVQYWWNQAQSMSSLGAIQANISFIPGDVMTHGLTVHLGLRF